MHNENSLLVINTHGGQWLLCEAGYIIAVGVGEYPTRPSRAEVIDARGLHLLPGFIDLHVHGALGHDTMDASSEALEAMAVFYASHGVTSFLATTWTDSTERIHTALEAVHAYQSEHHAGATLLGAHLEGPYLNPAKCGAQNLNHIRVADRAEVEVLLDTGVLRLISLAPEYPENHWLIEEAVSRGITVSAAHTNANFDDMQSTIDLGLSHATHTFNAMPALHHREPGALGAILTEPSISSELIADNIHVHPAIMHLLWMVKGPHNLILISDAVRVAGLSDGVYSLDDRTVTVHNRAVRLEDGTLAGSMLTMDVALRNFMAATNSTLEQVWPTTSLNAARAIHLDCQKGSLEPGKDADFILVDDKITVYLTVVSGNIVFRRND